MADDAASEEVPVTFNVKSSNDSKFVITMPLSATVLDLKAKLAGSEYADIPPESQRLIYSGRVLKDPDALSSYRLKEGNTIHLVKGAASNQRQNPASSNTGTANSGSTSTSASTGVPTNLAAGTGNNPLAGLTGARYAGFAQLPGAGMFGPDGGMGPPPDPEQMVSLLENPQFQSTMNEALQNPQVIDQLIQSNPMLRGMGPQVRQAMQDPLFRRMMTDPAMMRQVSQMSRQYGFGGAGAGGGEGAFPAPGITDTTPGQEGGGSGATNSSLPSFNPLAILNSLGAAGTNPAGAGGANAAANPFAALFQGPLATPATNPSAQAQGTPAAGTTASANANASTNSAGDPFEALTRNIMQNPAMLQQVLNSLGGGGGAGPGAAGTTPGVASPFNPLTLMGLGGPPQVPEQPRDTRPLEERYEDQLRQLNEMGFCEFERNIEALRRTGGSVQGAVEYLLTH